ncbi:Dynamin- GTPase protein [Spiromyces aspiralis]|uniref:Dynamin- GTPase protein n=1 Tax=Spiromyces aspiralis TaxID=68401 RepID=A0ACC1HSQ0_9FUNG|nr:Dynamin- GTPase protein [Spiromyces aspiralis]
MDSLIHTVNRLQDVFNKIGHDQIDLPQIVVVGSQSSGKSSVLENIVREDFLPRGTGIVTRRPLVLQLVQTRGTKAASPAASDNGNTGETRANNGDGDNDDDGSPSDVKVQFLHLPNRTFTDLAEVRTEIQRETDRLAGHNKGIERSPIHLKIFSPKVLNLTLVDLPGLTKIPVGDQPSDIERQTRDLVLEYISKPNSIILAISPANVDIANSESLKIAREVDPEGRRTVGIITKIDIMDKGTNALDILTGRIYPLRLGFIGVINRSQEDTAANKPVREALRQEAQFFRSHPVYRTIQKHCGTENLTKMLNQLLLTHIREKLPDIKTKISAMISQTEQELASFGQELPSADSNNASRLLKLITQYANKFNSSIEGTSAELPVTELCGGANLYYIFNHIYGASLDALQPTNNLTSKEIRTAIRNSTGPRASLFVPELAFQLLVKPQIKTLEPPSQRCVQLAYEELTKISLKCASNELRRYPRLLAKVLQVVSDLLRECVSPASNYVASLIAIERAYINTNHPDFIGGTGALKELQQKAKQKHHRGPKASRHKGPSSVSKGAAGGQHSVYDLDVDGENGEQIQVEENNLVNGETLHLHQRQASNLQALRLGATPTVAQGLRSGSPNPSTKFLQSFFGNTSRLSPGSVDAGIDGIRQKSAELPVPLRTISRANQDALYLGGDGTLDAEITNITAQFGEEVTVEERDEIEVTLIRSLITSYFNIVRKTIQDLVPKAIMHLLVGEVCQKMQNRLVEELYKEPLITELMEEDPSLKAEREQRMAVLEVYRQAFSTLNEAA